MKKINGWIKSNDQRDYRFDISSLNDPSDLFSYYQSKPPPHHSKLNKKKERRRFFLIKKQNK
jgi:hypothetical protein